MHYKRWRKNGDPLDPGGRTYTRIPPADRFWAKVDKSGDCWRWQGGKNRYGYGLFSNSNDERLTVLAHRFAYRAVKGEIPEGLQLDHLCRVRDCVNPDHLEPVTAAVNTARSFAMNPDHGSKRRKPRCPRGHLKEGVSPKGEHYCLPCNHARSAARRQAVRAGVQYRDPFAA